jgi:hypothetical protein
MLAEVAVQHIMVELLELEEPAEVELDLPLTELQEQPTLVVVVVVANEVPPGLVVQADLEL